MAHASGVSLATMTLRLLSSATSARAWLDTRASRPIRTTKGTEREGLFAYLYFVQIKLKRETKQWNGH